MDTPNCINFSENNNNNNRNDNDNNSIYSPYKIGKNTNSPHGYLDIDLEEYSINLSHKTNKKNIK